MHMSECQSMRRWVTHWVMIEKQEDRFPQRTKCSLCPLPYVHCQLHNLYLYTSPLETVSTGAIYWFNRSFFMLASTDSQACMLKQHRGNNKCCCYKPEWDLKEGISTSGSLLCICLCMCEKERKWGSREKINKAMEHIKSQCWVVRLTHWFPAVTYSIEHWMVDKVNKIEASVQLPRAANLIKLRGHRTGEV